jgi:hypothetical protein
MSTRFLPSKLFTGVLALGLAAVLGVSSGRTAEKTKETTPSKAVALSSEAWANAPRVPLTSAELDRLVDRELSDLKLQPTPLTTDEQFIRRVTLDLSGKLPRPSEVAEFIADKNPKKREALIDKLLAGDDYARHWAHYWREVIERRLTDQRGRLFARPFEDWLTAELKANKNWGELVRAMLTATGELRFEHPEKNPAAFFIASRMGTDAANEHAAEVSRVFLGIQIQCAQCHNHPYDQWKQVQFHELAAYFARLRERPIRDTSGTTPRIVGFELISARFGEHEMPNRDDPKKGTTVYPRFLDGKSPGKDLSDLQRRESLAAAVTDGNNFWFSAAYVNRVWGELLGQSFSNPVDDMGPQRQVVMRDVLVQLASSFRASEYDTRAFFRLVLNSTAYQRQLRTGESGDEHLHFAAMFPRRLSSEALWQSLVEVLGGMSRPDAAPPQGGGRGGPRLGFQGAFKETFAFDPSLKSDEIEGSIPQALMLMNNPGINQKIEARGTNYLAGILKSTQVDDDAVRKVYLHTLARKPTDRELDKCRAHIARAGSRGEAFEDILWALINSTEFQTKR